MSGIGEDYASQEFEGNIRLGIFGNREASFNSDLEMQMSDIRRLSMEGHSLCVIGDYNLSLGDNYYYTKFGRNRNALCFAGKVHDRY